MKKLTAIFIAYHLIGMVITCKFVTGQAITEKWGCFELTMNGPEEGNPFIDIQLSATFSNKNDTFQVDGFYDGNGTYKIRFMPTETGNWHYLTQSNHKMLKKKKDSLKCIEPGEGNNGPVVIRNKYHFKYASGHCFLPLGTTCLPGCISPIQCKR